MRTNIVLDDDLVAEAFQYSEGITTKKDLVDAALREYVAVRKMKDLREIRGEILFDPGYDYKAMRKGR